MSFFTKWKRNSQKTTGGTESRTSALEFLMEGEGEFDRILSAAEKKPEIRNILEKYSLVLDGGGLSVYRGNVIGRSTNSKDQITDIYWRLKASGVGEEIACAVINNADYLTTYLEMKANNITDVPIAGKLMDVFYK